MDRQLQDTGQNLLLKLFQVTNGLAVNSFTASGVVVKEEMDEKPNFLSELTPHPPSSNTLTLSDKTNNNKTDFSSILPDTPVESNNNQLEHFVSVNPGFQVY